VLEQPLAAQALLLLIERLNIVYLGLQSALLLIERLLEEEVALLLLVLQVLDLIHELLLVLDVGLKCLFVQLLVAALSELLNKLTLLELLDLCLLCSEFSLELAHRSGLAFAELLQL